MASSLTPKMTPFDMEDATISAAAACEADPDAEDKAALIEAWLPAIDAQIKVERDVRHLELRIVARRKVAAVRLDDATTRFGKDLLIECGLDRESPLFVSFFTRSPSETIAMPLAEHINLAKGWLSGTSTPAALEKHRASLTLWSDKAQQALQDEQSLTQARAAAHAGREALAADLTKKRDATEDELATRGRELGLPREWAVTFFR